MSVIRRIAVPVLRYQIFAQDIKRRSLHKLIHQNVNITSKIVDLTPQNMTSNVIRCKSQKNQVDSDDEEDFMDDDSSLSKDSKVVKFSTTSMRTDTIIKSALSMSRNKIEQLFYESKIRVNGKKILKKSASVRVGDELDIIKMVSPKNPEHLYVARVEVINVVPKEDAINVTARRFKNLLIENYDTDPYKMAAEKE